MWLYLIAVVLVVVGIAGGIFGGGIFTILLLPLAAIVVISAVVYSAMARSAAQKAGHADAGRERGGVGSPLPRQREPSPDRTPATPEQLVDERRVRQ